MVEVANGSIVDNNGSSNVFDPVNQEDYDLTYPWSEPTPSCSDSTSPQFGFPFANYGEAKERPFFLRGLSKINLSVFNFSEEGSSCGTEAEPLASPLFDVTAELGNLLDEYHPTSPSLTSSYRPLKDFYLRSDLTQYLDPKTDELCNKTGGTESNYRFEICVEKPKDESRLNWTVTRKFQGVNITAEMISRLINFFIGENEVFEKLPGVLATDQNKVNENKYIHTFVTEQEIVQDTPLGTVSITKQFINSLDKRVEIDPDSGEIIIFYEHDLKRSMAHPFYSEYAEPLSFNHNKGFWRIKINSESDEIIITGIVDTAQNNEGFGTTYYLLRVVSNGTTLDQSFEKTQKFANNYLDYIAGIIYE